MQVALSLQYFPADGESPVVTVYTTTSPTILRRYRRYVLMELERRADGAAEDPVASLIARTEVERMRDLLDFLMPGVRS